MIAPPPHHVPGSSRTRPEECDKIIRWSIRKTARGLGMRIDADMMDDLAQAVYCLWLEWDDRNTGDGFSLRWAVRGQIERHRRRNRARKHKDLGFLMYSFPVEYGEAEEWRQLLLDSAAGSRALDGAVEEYVAKSPAGRNKGCKEYNAREMLADYYSGDGNLRDVGKRHGISGESVRMAVKKFERLLSERLGVEVDTSGRSDKTVGFKLKNRDHESFESMGRKTYADPDSMAKIRWGGLKG